MSVIVTCHNLHVLIVHGPKILNFNCSTSASFNYMKVVTCYYDTEYIFLIYF